MSSIQILKENQEILYNYFVLLRTQTKEQKQKQEYKQCA